MINLLKSIFGIKPKTGRDRVREMMSRGIPVSLGGDDPMKPTHVKDPETGEWLFLEDVLN
jgi:hypothetical protein